MKKTASISLILLTLLIAVQPVLYFHFCKGKLTSLTLQNTSETSCCDNKLPFDSVHKAGCCNDNTIIISADNFQVPKAQFNFNLVSVFVIVQNNLLTAPGFSADFEKEALVPISTLFKKALDRLAFICVYRI